MKNWRQAGQYTPPLDGPAQLLQGPGTTGVVHCSTVMVSSADLVSGVTIVSGDVVSGVTIVALGD